MYSDELTIPEQIKTWDLANLNDPRTHTEPDVELVERIENIQPKMRQALDIGCGWGRNLVYLASKGWRCTGFDWSQEALNQAKATLDENNERVNFVKGDFRRLPFDTGQFHLVISTNVLNHGHSADMRRALIEIKRVLAIGGTAVISVPSLRNAPGPSHKNWVEEGTVVLWDGWEKGIPHHFFTRSELEELTRTFRTSQIDAAIEPFPHGYEPVNPEQVNEWFWITLVG